MSALVGNTKNGTVDLNPSMKYGSASGPPTADRVPPKATVPDKTQPVTRLVIDESATIGNL